MRRTPCAVAVAVACGHFAALGVARTRRARGPPEARSPDPTAAGGGARAGDAPEHQADRREDPTVPHAGLRERAQHGATIRRRARGSTRGIRRRERVRSAGMRDRLMAVDEAPSPSTVAGTYSSTHPMEGEGPKLGQVTWSVVMRDGAGSPASMTRADLDAWAKRTRRGRRPDDRGGRGLECELHLDPSGRFVFRGPLGAADSSPSTLTGTWRLHDGDVVLTVEREAQRADPIPRREIVCHCARGFVYFPWSNPAFPGRAEVQLAKRV
jgi:hypothetical protein